LSVSARHGCLLGHLSQRHPPNREHGSRSGGRTLAVYGVPQKVSMATFRPLAPSRRLVSSSRRKARRALHRRVILITNDEFAVCVTILEEDNLSRLDCKTNPIPEVPQCQFGGIRTSPRSILDSRFVTAIEDHDLSGCREMCVTQWLEPRLLRPGSARAFRPWLSVIPPTLGQFAYNRPRGLSLAS
jgi:hypothetical protein